MTQAVTTPKPVLPGSNAGLVYVGRGERYPDWATPPAPGDFVLFRDPDNVISKIIRFGQRFRVHGDCRRFAWWNHAALVVDDDGGLIEAQGQGVVRTTLDDHAKESYVVVRTDTHPHDAKQIDRLARQVVGIRYGFLTILSIGLSMLTGMKFGFGTDASFICSGLVAEAQLRAGAIFSRPARLCSPADLARYYDVDPPLPGATVYEAFLGETAMAEGDGTGDPLLPYDPDQPEQTSGVVADSFEVADSDSLDVSWTDPGEGPKPSSTPADATAGELTVEVDVEVDVLAVELVLRPRIRRT